MFPRPSSHSFACVPSGAFTDDGQRKFQAFVLLFAVFDESKSWYGAMGERTSRDKFKWSPGRKEYHTINGYVNSTLPGKQAARVRGCSMKTSCNVKCY